MSTYAFVSPDSIVCTYNEKGRWKLANLDTATKKLQPIKTPYTDISYAGYLSIPQAIEFPTEHGLTAYAFYYPPKNQDFLAPAGEKPPLLSYRTADRHPWFRAS